jgi:hypothetical protein
MIGKDKEFSWEANLAVQPMGPKVPPPQTLFPEEGGRV